MTATATAKKMLGVCNCLQLLKLMKFVNVFIPKFALATEILSHGLVRTAHTPPRRRLFPPLELAPRLAGRLGALHRLLLLVDLRLRAAL